jgi:hypothetical protein
MTSRQNLGLSGVGGVRRFIIGGVWRRRMPRGIRKRRKGGCVRNVIFKERML